MLAGAVLCAPLFLRAQTPTRRNPARQRTLPNAASPSAAEQPKFKGIFEPLNYNQDLKLTDVFFVTVEEGWVSGDHGTILHTSDGGKAWQAQLGGDPQSQEPSIDMLRFVDRTHGWAVQGNKLLRTRDGQSWEQVGTLPQGWGLQAYVFLSPVDGVLLDGNKNVSHIFRTYDGGRSWKEVFPPAACRATLQIQGLSREAQCTLTGMHFASAKIGYAAGGSWTDFNTLFTAKTEDGGNTWSVSSLPDVGGVFAGGAFATLQSIFFTDPRTGFLSLNGAKLLATKDGGQSWQGVVGSPGPRFVFADPEVGWSPSIDFGSFALHYTTDGGQHWATRTIQFPANVTAFSLPTRQRAYVVGEHGMIYRYSVLPANYQAAAHSIDAPAMPGYDSSLNGEVATIKSAVNDLATQMQNSLGISVPPTASAGPMPQGTGGGFQQSASAPPGQDMSQGGFQQSAPGAGTPGQSMQQGSFQQDTGGPGGGIVAPCCGPTLQKLEMAANTLATDLPKFSGKFRNLNLITAGLLFVNNLLQQANALKLAINNLRQARDKQSAAAALGALSGQVNGIPSDVNGGFVQDTSPYFPQAPPPATPMSSGNTGQAARPGASQQAGAPATSAQDSSAASSPEDKAAQKANENVKKLKDQIKKKIKVPW